MAFLTEEKLDILRSKGAKIADHVQIDELVKIENPEKFEIGSHSRIDSYTLVFGDVKIKRHVHVAPFCLFAGRYGILLEDNTNVSAHSQIYSADADYSKGSGLINPTIPLEFRGTYNGPVHFERFASIGTHCTVLPNSVLGEGSRFGKGCVIHGKYPGWKLYATDNRAKPLLDVPKETILENWEKLLESEK